METITVGKDKIESLSRWVAKVAALAYSLGFVTGMVVGVWIGTKL